MTVLDSCKGHNFSPGANFRLSPPKVPQSQLPDFPAGFFFCFVGPKLCSLHLLRREEPREKPLFIAGAPGLLRAPGGEPGQTSPGGQERSTTLVLILILIFILCSPAVPGECVPVPEQGRYRQKPLPQCLFGAATPICPQVWGRFPSSLQVNPPRWHRRCFARGNPPGLETPPMCPLPTWVSAKHPDPGTPAAASEGKPQT